MKEARQTGYVWFDSTKTYNCAKCKLIYALAADQRLSAAGYKPALEADGYIHYMISIVS